MKFHRMGSISICTIVLSLFSAHVSSATYDYISENYLSGYIDNTLSIEGSYDSSMQVSWTFDVLTDLESNLDTADISSDVLSYSFFDGRNTLTEQNSLITWFYVSTDSAGDIYSWIFNVSTHLDYSNGGWFDQGELGYRIISRSGTSGSYIEDFHQGAMFLCEREGGCDSFFVVQGAFESGVYKNTVFASPPTSPVPIPAAAWLFGSGLLGLIGVARRKKAT